MRKFIFAIIIVLSLTAIVNADTISLNEVNSNNYLQYEKSIKDRYGYNKGDDFCCSNEYIPYEELFYTDGVDHWNVGLVYDESLIEDLLKTSKPNTTTVTKSVAKKIKTKTIKTKKSKKIKKKKITKKSKIKKKKKK